MLVLGVLPVGFLNFLVTFHGKPAGKVNLHSYSLASEILSNPTGAIGKFDRIKNSCAQTVKDSFEYSF